MKRLLILLLMICHYAGEGQILSMASKDSLNGVPRKKVFFTAWLKFNSFIDTRGIPSESAMHIPSIPTAADNFIADPRYHADLNQSRLKFGFSQQTRRMGEITSYIEADFWGGENGGQLRLRHAYAEFFNFRVGQSWSSFVDTDSWPNITDFDGPATGVWTRTAQVAYEFRWKNKYSLQASIELPSADYSRFLTNDSLISPANQSIPDVVGHLRRTWSWGHAQLGFVSRFPEYRRADSIKTRGYGFGFNFSGSWKNRDHDKLIWQLTAGKGIARYLVSFGGGGWDGLPNAEGKLEEIPVYGGYLSYQYYWGRKLSRDGKARMSTTLLYGSVYLVNPLDEDFGSSMLIQGYYGSANLYWHVEGPLNVAMEVIYANRTDETGSSGGDTRIHFILEYNF